LICLGIVESIVQEPVALSHRCNRAIFGAMLFSPPQRLESTYCLLSLKVILLSQGSFLRLPGVTSWCFFGSNVAAFHGGFSPLRPPPLFFAGLLGASGDMLAPMISWSFFVTRDSQFRRTCAEAARTNPFWRFPFLFATRHQPTTCSPRPIMHPFF